jgi:hypothetical protein
MTKAWVDLNNVGQVKTNQWVLTEQCFSFKNNYKSLWWTVIGNCNSIIVIFNHMRHKLILLALHSIHFFVFKKNIHNNNRETTSAN